MCFVNNSLFERMARWPVIVPIEGLIHDDTFGNKGRIIAFVTNEIFIRVVQWITEHFGRPFDIAADRARIRIEKNFGGIKTMSLGRVPGTMDSITIQLARPHIGKENMPDFIRALFESYAGGFLCVTRLVEET